MKHKQGHNIWSFHKVWFWMFIADKLMYYNIMSTEICAKIKTKRCTSVHIYLIG